MSAHIFYPWAHCFALRAWWTLIKEEETNLFNILEFHFAECSSTLDDCSQATEFWELLQTGREELSDVLLLILDQHLLFVRDFKRWTSCAHFSSQFKAPSRVCVLAETHSHSLKWIFWSCVSTLTAAQSGRHQVCTCCVVTTNTEKLQEV